MTAITSFNAFSASSILSAVNKELADGGIKTIATEVIAVSQNHGNQALLKTRRGSHLVAKLWNPSNLVSAMGIRAIHRVTRKDRPYTILFNGQAGKNLTTLIFNGENGPIYYANKADTSKYLTNHLMKQCTKTHILERIHNEAKSNHIISSEISAHA